MSVHAQWMLVAAGAAWRLVALQLQAGQSVHADVRRAYAMLAPCIVAALDPDGHRAAVASMYRQLQVWSACELLAGCFLDRQSECPAVTDEQWAHARSSASVSGAYGATVLRALRTPATWDAEPGLSAAVAGCAPMRMPQRALPWLAIGAQAITPASLITWESFAVSPDFIAIWQGGAVARATDTLLSPPPQIASVGDASASCLGAPVPRRPHLTPTDDGPAGDGPADDGPADDGLTAHGLIGSVSTADAPTPVPDVRDARIRVLEREREDLLRILARTTKALTHAERRLACSAADATNDAAARLDALERSVAKQVPRTTPVVARVVTPSPSTPEHDPHALGGLRVALCSGVVQGTQGARYMDAFAAVGATAHIVDSDRMSASTEIAGADIVVLQTTHMSHQSSGRLLQAARARGRCIVYGEGGPPRMVATAIARWAVHTAVRHAAG